MHKVSQSEIYWHNNQCIKADNTSKAFVKGNADGPPYELRNAGIIIILFLATLLVCRASSIIYV